MPAFTPFFNVDYPAAMPSTLSDEGWAAYHEVEAKQKAAVPEAELRDDARNLIKDIAKCWSSGVYSTMGLGELLKEKRRRLREELEASYDVNDRLAAWVRECMRPGEDEVDEHALPSPQDCSKLINDVAHCGDDGLGRPAFYDIAD